jgi:hypothetical protein
MKRNNDGPDFLILGAQRAGTTSLYDYLVRHPNVLPPRTKEVHFFDLHYHLGWDWYQAELDARAAERAGDPSCLRGEASPYYLFHPVVPGRVLRHSPRTRFIVLLREPVERAYSQYHHEVRLGMETLSFDEALAREDERLAGIEEKHLTAATTCVPHQHHTYQARGRYAEQLEAWWKNFPPKQFLVLFSENLQRDPLSHTRAVLEFLGMPALDLGPYPKSNHGGQYLPMNQSTRHRLNAYFAPYNRELARLLEERYTTESLIGTAPLF